MVSRITLHLLALRTLDIYQFGLRPILFSGLKVDAEWAHQQAMQALSWLDETSDRPTTAWLQTKLKQSFSINDHRLQQTLWNLEFPNPVGLAAGFDKNGVAAGIWSTFGFGFAELGTVTFQAQPGNPQPRLFRLIPDQAVLNRMGFNNQGAAAMAASFARKSEQRQALAQRQMHLRPKSPPNHRIPLGINLGKSKVTPLEEAATDYLGSLQLLYNWGDYFVINVSSPNTPDLRRLQAVEQLELIVSALQQANFQGKPILVKIAPDLDWDAIAAVVDLVESRRLAGIIATNTTISRTGLKTEVLEATGKSIQAEAGGISGAPLRQRSTDVIRFIYQHTQGRVPIIGVGGIFTAEDAWEKITAGASLIQVYTGWIYEGPWMIRRILQGVLQRLEAEGMRSISEAVGMHAANSPVPMTTHHAT